MKHLYFIRHGQSEFNRAIKWAGSSDTPLTPKGIAQATAAGELLKLQDLSFDLIISSPLERALHTAQIVAVALDYPPENIMIRDNLVERDFGVLEGNKKLVAATRYMIDESSIDSYQGVEKLEDLQTRAAAFYDYLQSLEQESILVAGHGAFGRALRRHILKKPLSYRGTPFKNAECVRLV